VEYENSSSFSEKNPHCIGEEEQATRDSKKRWSQRQKKSPGMASQTPRRRNFREEKVNCIPSSETESHGRTSVMDLAT
jgi:hypothetical protein